MDRSLARRVDDLGIAACVLYVLGYVLFPLSTVSYVNAALRAAQPMTLVTGLAMSACVIVIMLKIHRMRSGVACMVAALIAVLALSAILTKDVRLLEGALLIIAATGIDKQRLVKWVAVALAAGIAVVVLASLCGQAWNKDVVPNDYLVFSYGFGHPNTLGAMLACLAAAILYVGWSHRAWVLSVAMAMLLALFSKTMLSSNTAAVLIFAYGAASVLGHLLGERLAVLLTKRARVLIACGIALVVMVGMLYLMVAYDNNNPVHVAINDLLHSRPYYGAEYYRAHGGFTILGRPYLSVTTYHQGTPFQSLDSGVMYMGGVYGLLPLLCGFVMFAYLVAHLPEDGRSFFVWAMIVLGILNLLTESTPLFVYANVTLLLLSDGLASSGRGVFRASPRLA